MQKGRIIRLILGDATVPVLTAGYLIYLVYTRRYRDWRIYKAIMGSKAKTHTRDDPFLPKKKNEELLSPDVPPDEEPKE